MTEEKGKVVSDNNRLGALSFLTSKIRTGPLYTNSQSQNVTKSQKVNEEETKVDTISKSSLIPQLPSSSLILSNGPIIRYNLLTLRQMGIKIINKGNLQPTSLLKEYMVDFQSRLTKQRPIMPELHFTNVLRQTVPYIKDNSTHYIKDNSTHYTKDNVSNERTSTVSLNKSTDHKKGNNIIDYKNNKNTNDSSDQHSNNKDTTNLKEFVGNNNDNINNNNTTNSGGGGNGRLTEDEKRKMFEQERFDLLEMRNKKKNETAVKLESSKIHQENNGNSLLLGYGNTTVGSYHDESDQIMEMFKAESGQITKGSEAELKLAESLKEIQIAPQGIPQSNNDSLETNWFNDFLKTPLNESFEFGSMNKNLDVGLDNIVSSDGLGLGIGLGSSKSVKQSRLQTLFNDATQDSTSIQEDSNIFNSSILSPSINNSETSFIIPNKLDFNDNNIEHHQHMGNQIPVEMKGTTKMSLNSLFSAATKNHKDSNGSSNINFNSLRDISPNNPQISDVIKSIDVLSKLGVSPATPVNHGFSRSPTPFDNNDEEVFLPNSNTTPVKAESPNPTSQFAFHGSNTNTSSTKKKPVMSAAARQSLMKKTATIQPLSSINTANLPDPKASINEQISQLPSKPNSNKPSPNNNFKEISLDKPSTHQNKGLSLHKPKVTSPSSINTTNNNNSPNIESPGSTSLLGRKIDFHTLLANPSHKQVI